RARPLAARATTPRTRTRRRSTPRPCAPWPRIWRIGVRHRRPALLRRRRDRRRAPPRLRRLPPLPDVLQLLPVVPVALRRDRPARGARRGRSRGADGRGDQAGRRSVLAVQAVLREVSLHAAAQIRGGLPPPPDAREAGA